MKPFKKWLCGFFCVAILLAMVACDSGENSDHAKDYLFSHNGITVAINAEAEPILTALGTPNAYDESPSCAFEGLDKVYSYAGFRIQTYPLNGKDYIYMVYIEDDSVALTQEGIRVGDSRATVIEAYGEADTATSTALIYRGKGMTLEFLLTANGTVSTIKYVRTED
ncbi:MAG: hypothetical protein IJW92_03215 [Clostridia bacterium]|nr:hypothetical protein [Clostridia bacterium]